MWVAINLSSALRNSAATHRFNDDLGDRGMGDCHRPELVWAIDDATAMSEVPIYVELKPTCRGNPRGFAM